MEITKIPYRGKYPSAARALMEEGVVTTPRQYIRTLRWAYGLDIVYTLQGLTPANFQKYSQQLLLLAEQEARRYDKYQYKFAGFDVRLNRLKKGKDLREICTFSASMNYEPETLVWGPGYDTPKREFLFQKVP